MKACSASAGLTTGAACIFALSVSSGVLKCYSSIDVLHVLMFDLCDKGCFRSVPTDYGSKPQLCKLLQATMALYLLATFAQREQLPMRVRAANQSPVLQKTN